VLCCDLIGALSPGGAFALLGRSDRIVKIEETRVGLDEVEAAISALAEVAAVRVFPLTRGRRTALAGVVIPSELGWAALSERGRRAMVATLTARLRRDLPEAALPRRWRFARALPQNAHGKITTAALEALFANAMDRVMEPERLGAMTEGDGPVVMLRVQPELCYFDGHFDGAPILPGVVLIDWAVRMARSRFGIEQPFLRLEAVKFFRVASAGIELQLALSRKPGSDKIGFQFTSAAGQHSSGRILFGREQEDAA
jgi:3-hydroxymyristoyl/3-hydroxydecanoyl-(acyl carrier protein) dehydratase